MDQITEVPRRSFFADVLQNAKRIAYFANPLKGREKVGIPSVILDSDPITRRRFLGHLWFLGLAIVALGLPKGSDKPSVPYIKTPTQPKPEIPVVDLPKQPSDNLEERIFKNFSPAEKTDVEKEIAKQIKDYQQQIGHERKAARVLDWEKTTIAPILKLDVPVEKRQFWSEFMSAIAYMESGGKATATSEAEIIGVAQISQATAKATAKKHGIRTFDLKKGWDSLRLSRFHFQDLMERFSTDISLLGYFAGQPFTDQKILDRLKGKDLLSDQQTRSYIDRFGVNIENLGSEDGKEYFKKFVAALRILKKARSTPWPKP